MRVFVDHYCTISFIWLGKIESTMRLLSESVQLTSHGSLDCKILHVPSSKTIGLLESKIPPDQSIILTKLEQTLFFRAMSHMNQKN